MELGKIASLRARMEVWNVERGIRGKLKKYSNHSKFYCSNNSQK
jgi:hypothetical protein